MKMVLLMWSHFKKIGSVSILLFLNKPFKCMFEHFHAKILINLCLTSEMGIIPTVRPIGVVEIERMTLVWRRTTYS